MTHFNQAAIRAVNDALDNLVFAMDEAHDPQCKQLLALEADDGRDGDCDCGLQALEEAIGLVGERVGEVS